MEKSNWHPLANYNQILNIANTYFHNPGKGKVWGAYPAWGYTWDYGGSVKAVYSFPSVDITSISALFMLSAWVEALHSSALACSDRFHLPVSK